MGVAAALKVDPLRFRPENFMIYSPSSKQIGSNCYIDQTNYYDYLEKNVCMHRNSIATIYTTSSTYDPVIYRTIIVFRSNIRLGDIIARMGYPSRIESSGYSWRYFWKDFTTIYGSNGFLITRNVYWIQFNVPIEKMLVS